MNQHPESESSRFVENLLVQCGILSYPDRLQKAVKVDQLFQLIPEVPKPNFPQEHSEIAKEIIRKLEETANWKTLKAWLDESLAEGKFTVSEKLELFSNCFFFLGSKSFTDLTVLLQRFQPIFSSLVTKPEDKSNVLKYLADFWGKSLIPMEIMTDRLLISRIVDTQSVINWVFSDKLQRFDGIVNSLVWKILTNALSKLSLKAEIMQENLSDLVSGPTKMKVQEVFSAISEEIRNSIIGILNNCVIAYNQTSNVHHRHVISGRVIELLRTYWKQVIGNIDLQLKQSLSAMDPRISNMFNEAMETTSH